MTSTVVNGRQVDVDHGRNPGPNPHGFGTVAPGQHHPAPMSTTRHQGTSTAYSSSGTLEF